MFTKGEVVTVYNQTLGTRRTIIEGRATILGPGNVEDQYRVRFIKQRDTGVYLRFVYPGECQSDPQAYIAKAEAAWQEGRDAQDESLNRKAREILGPRQRALAPDCD